MENRTETEYRALCEDELSTALFSSFIRRQEVTLCLRREQGAWVEREAPFTDDWSAEEYAFLVKCLRHTLRTGGFVYGAFRNGQLKGFVSVEAQPFGKHGNYLDLSCIHVSEDMRGNGIGRQLFLAAGDWARAHGAEKLYISSHSAVETQAFYREMGCTDAQEIMQAHAEAEPYDRQLECRL